MNEESKNVVDRKKGGAITSLICGIMGGFIPTLGIVAVIFGHIAISKIKKQPELYGGKGMAIAGLILGYLIIILSLIKGVLKGLIHSQLNNG